ncbi:MULTISPECIES: sugar ABC transporter substrate-binding protein [Streptomyces]|uniref:ABC transporter substrate-binding protein n=2 Tax=Streptomyces TaxID=1883 RepID=A0A2N8PKI9_STRNR|nr:MULTISPECIES: sugar ABC transporter substrate-binding protein [Streptomyces]PNE41534.1 ABC transporter substrate-binding protein [Streptomyces noursei]QRX91418.1 sugar ABC transporter substrate-binding protein [Streptomyces noursei]UJB41194.1 sugar ABC transporter substrate-binding protein [Streptomyces sp. A1-5]SHM07459.1 ribose transport system substrate-binding protein [Streptomyces yunnanensis]
MRLRTRTTGAAAGAAVLALAVLAGAAVLTGCNRGSDATGRIGIDVPRTDTDFWDSYQDHLKADLAHGGPAALPLANSQNDIGKVVSDVQALTGQGARAIVIAPQDTGAITAELRRLADRRIPVVSVDTRPDDGPVYMVVRADNRAYGERSCVFLGERLGGHGRVAELQGDLSSINGRDRSEAFAACMKRRYPGITVHELATDWKGEVASAKLQSLLAQHHDLDGVYLQAGGAFLQPVLALLRQRGLLEPVGTPGHLTLVSNDGIPDELAAIRAGTLDATLSQPADLYARYALYYARAALAGKTFRPGPTDHGSTIVKIKNGLEDQLPAPLVTKENVNDPHLWANQSEQGK